MVSLGTVFARSFPAAEVVPWARATEAAGFDDLWVIEDYCFTAAPSLAAAALATTEQISVGLGILPVPGRNAAVAAMEIATLDALAPGRLVAGLGHGVTEWVEQVGAPTRSPLTRLEEVTSAVRALLRGETVTVDGTEVQLDAVRLDPPPAAPPPLLLGVRGPRSLRLAGRVADGVVLAELAGPAYVRYAREQMGAGQAAVYVATHVDDDRMAARRWMAGFVREQLQQPGIALRTAPGHDEAVVAAAEGEEALVHLPDAWWREIGAIGDPDDIYAHVSDLVAAGADRLAFLVTPELDVAQEQLNLLTALLPTLRG